MPRQSGDSRSDPCAIVAQEATQFSSCLKQLICFDAFKRQKQPVDT